MTGSWPFVRACGASAGCLEQRETLVCLPLIRYSLTPAGLALAQKLAESENKSVDVNPESQGTPGEDPQEPGEASAER